MFMTLSIAELILYFSEIVPNSGRFAHNSIVLAPPAYKMAILPSPPNRRPVVVREKTMRPIFHMKEEVTGVKIS